MEMAWSVMTPAEDGFEMELTKIITVLQCTATIGTRLRSRSCTSDTAAADPGCRYSQPNSRSTADDAEGSAKASTSSANSQFTKQATPRLGLGWEQSPSVVTTVVLDPDSPSTGLPPTSPLLCHEGEVHTYTAMDFADSCPPITKVYLV